MHDALRKRWALVVARGEGFCARCGEWIPSEPARIPCPRCRKLNCGFDLGHHDLDRSKHTGPEHRCCNRAVATHAKRRRMLARATPRANWW